MLKYGAASELHAPPRVLESHQPLSSLPTSLRSYRQWILAASLRAIEYQGKWKENEKCFESDIRLDEVNRLPLPFRRKRRTCVPRSFPSFNNTYVIYILLNLRCLVRVTVSKIFQSPEILDNHVADRSVFTSRSIEIPYR